MKIKSVCMFLTTISVIGRVIYLTAIPLTNSSIPLISIITSVILLIYGLYLMITSNMRTMKATGFMPFIICNWIAVIINIIVCKNSNRIYFNIWEHGILGGIWEMLIYGVLVFLIIVDYFGIRKRGQNTEKFL